MTDEPQPLRLSRIYGETFQLFWRDFPLIMALWLPLCAAGVLGAAWVATLLPSGGAARPTAVVVPWMIVTLPSFLADAAVVWVALRRLRGGRAPALGGWVGVAMTLGAVIAVDLVENVANLAQTLVPAAVTDPIEPFYSLAALIVTAFWAALWMPAVAVAVDERKGGPMSLGRGLGLATGHLSTLTTFALSIYVAARLLGFAIRYALAAAGLGIPWLLELLLLPIGAFASVSQAVVYWELTRLKTGLTPAGAAEVFS